MTVQCKPTKARPLDMNLEPKSINFVRIIPGYENQASAKENGIQRADIHSKESIFLTKGVSLSLSLFVCRVSFGQRARTIAVGVFLFHTKKGAAAASVSLCIN